MIRKKLNKPATHENGFVGDSMTFGDSIGESNYVVIFFGESINKKTPTFLSGSLPKTKL